MIKMSSIDDLFNLCVLNNAQLYEDDEGFILLTDYVNPVNSCCFRVSDDNELYIWNGINDSYQTANFNIPNNYKNLIVKQKRIYNWN